MILGVEKVPFTTQYPSQRGEFPIEHAQFKVRIRPKLTRLRIRRLDARSPWPGNCTETFDLGAVTGVLQLVLVLQRPVIPEAIEQLLLSVLDFIQAPRFLYEIRFSKQFLEL